MPAPPLTDERCPSCGGVITLEFCDVCGEKRPSRRAYTLAEFVHETFEVFTNAERSFLRTMWTLARKPGELTAAYMRGERVRYLKPFQLFLLVNVIFFFTAGSGVSMYSTSLHVHMNSTPYRETARQVVQDMRPATGMFMPDYERAFNQKSLVLARTLVVVLIPAFAIGIGLLSVNRSSSAVQAIVFSTHALGMLMLLTVVVVRLVLLGSAAAVTLGAPPTDDVLEDAATLLLGAGFFAYLYVALRRVYGDGRVAAGVKAALGMAALIYALVGYRLLLFYVTVYTL